MLPAFRVNGLWPRSRGIRRSDGAHPVTGAPMRRFESTETIVQLPMKKYDELVADSPEYRLKYLDEDRDEITIGSELELVAKLEEPTSHSHLIRKSVHARNYTDIPECMHAFHIGGDEEARKIWTFLESTTISRNRTAYKLWMTPKLTPSDSVRDLLNDHAYEFMTGYNFEGFNSHYNYLSETGQQIKAITTQKEHSANKPTNRNSSPETSTVKVPSSPSESSSSLDLMEPARTMTESPSLKEIETERALPEDLVLLTELPDKAHQQADKTPVSSGEDSESNKSLGETLQTGPDDTFALTHAKVSESMASLNNELDKHLETAQALTRMLDQSAGAHNDSVGQEAIQKQFDYQFEVARSTTKMINAMTKDRQSLSYVSSQSSTSTSEIQGQETTNVAVSSMPSNPSLGFAKYATASKYQGIYSHGVDSKELDASVQGSSSSATPTQEYLTDLGIKVSREAGMKLRSQLFGMPKPHNGTTQDNVHRWIARASDPPNIKVSGTTGQTAKPMSCQLPSYTNIPLSKKKSVRFSFPASARGEWHLDGSFSPGSRTVESPTMLDMVTNQPWLPQNGTATMQNQKSPPNSEPSHCKDESKITASTSLSESEVVKVRELIALFGESPKESITRIVEQYKANLKAKDTALEQEQSSLDVPPRPVAPRPFETAPQIVPQQIPENSSTDSVETMITKLWCQAYEGIMSNIDTFTEQLDTHIKSQISKEQAILTALLSQESPSGSLENDQTFLDNAKHVKDLIAVQENVQRMVARLRTWNSTSKDLLAPPGLCTEYKIDTERLQKTINGLDILSCSMELSFNSLLQTFLAISDHASAGISTPNNDSQGTAEPKTASPQLQWIPRRYASKVPSSDLITQPDKPYNKFHPSKDPANSPCSHLSKEGLPGIQSRTIHPAMPVVARNIRPSRNVQVVANSTPRRPSFPPFLSRAPVLHEPYLPKHTATNPFGASVSLRDLPASQDHKTDSKDEPIGSGPGPSEVLLPNFPPLIPRREIQRETRRDAEKQSPPYTSSQSQSSIAFPVIADSPFKNVNFHSYMKRNAAPVWRWNPHRTQHESALTQQLNAVPSTVAQHRYVGRYEPHPSFTMSPPPKSTKPVLGVPHGAEVKQDMQAGKIPSPRQSDESLNGSVKVSETFGTWSEDALLPTTQSVPENNAVAREASVSKQDKEIPPASLFQLYQDIPEHRDPRTAVKIMKCVETLKDMGCSNRVDGNDARLVVYAQAAGGNLEAALDIMDEERKAYAEQKDRHDSYLLD